MNSKYIKSDLRQDAEFQELYDAGFCLPDEAVFIKADECNGKSFWGIYNADGERVAVTDNRECAFALARQNDFEPCSVH